MSARILAAVLAGVLLSGAALAQTGEKRVLAGYYPSWFEPEEGTLSAVPASYTHVILAFARPDFFWNGKTWSGTGLQFPQSPAAIKKQIAALQARGTKVVLAVGGATYLKWAPLAAEADKPGKITAALSRFIADMGLDGLDIDYETDGASPKQIAEYRGAIKALGHAAGADRTLSLAAWSTGADCTKATGTGPCGGKTSGGDGRNGRERLVLADASIAGKLTMIHVMSYDAGVDEFDPVKAWSLYRGLVPERVIVNIGLEVSPEGWGAARLVTGDAKAVCPGAKTKADQFGNPVNKPYSVERILKDGPLSNARDGAMVWHIFKSKGVLRCGREASATAQEVESAARALLDRP